MVQLGFCYCSIEERGKRKRKEDYFGANLGGRLVYLGAKLSRPFKALAGLLVLTGTYREAEISRGDSLARIRGGCSV